MEAGGEADAAAGVAGLVAAVGDDQRDGGAAGAGGGAEGGRAEEGAVRAGYRPRMRHEYTNTERRIPLAWLSATKSLIGCN